MAGFKVAEGYVEVDVDYARLDSAIAGIKSRLAAVKDASISLGINQKRVDADIAEIMSKIKALQAKALSLGGINQAEFDASLAEIKAKLLALQDFTTIDMKVSGVTEAVAQLELLRASQAENIALFERGTGVIGRWNATIQLFGGYLTRIGVPAMLATVGTIHLVIDAIGEILAVLVPAGIALGAFGIAASSTFADIAKSEQAMFTVTTALGGAFPGLSAGLQGFTDSVKPQVYILFGEALDTINNHTSTFQKLALGAGQVLDGLGARVEAALGSSGLDGFVSKGVSDLQLLGNVIGNVFGILGNFFHALPGIAEVLFTIIQNVTGALELMTSSSIVQGIMNIGLAFHGALIWGGLLVTGIVALQTPLTDLGIWFFGIIAAIRTYIASVVAAEGVTATFEAILAPLAAVNPFVWVAVAVAALTLLVVWLVNSKTAWQQQYDAIMQNENAATTFVQAQQILAQGLIDTTTQLQQTSKTITVMTYAGKDNYRMVTELNPAYQGLQQNVAGLSAAQQTLGVRMTELVKITGSQSQAESDLNAIGVKAGQIATESAAAYNKQKLEIQALTDATTQLAGFTRGEAAGAQNALTNIYMNETLPAIQKIVQAEDNLINVITGGQLAFDTFGQGIATLATNFNQVTGTSLTTTHNLAGLKSTASLAGAALDGTTQASDALNAAFYTSIQNAQKLNDSLMMQSISQKDLTKVVATSAGQMIGYAGNNKAARDSIVALINNALGPGTTSLQNLDQWVGTNQVSMGQYRGIIDKTTASATQLTGVLNQTMQQMQAIALFQAEGGQAAWNTFTADIIRGKTNSDSFRQSLADVATQLAIQSNGSLPAAKRAFEEYTNELGLSKAQADQLWQQALPSLQKTIDQMHGKDIKITANTTGALSSIQQFQAQVNALHGITVQIGAQVYGTQAIAQAFAPLAGATGMKITQGTTPTADDVLVRVSKGETIVSAQHSAMLAPVFQQLGVPGYASGGTPHHTSTFIPVSEIAVLLAAGLASSNSNVVKAAKKVQSDKGDLVAERADARSLYGLLYGKTYNYASIPHTSGSTTSHHTTSHKTTHHHHLSAAHIQHLLKMGLGSHVTAAHEAALSLEHASAAGRQSAASNLESVLHALHMEHKAHLAYLKAHSGKHHQSGGFIPAGAWGYTGEAGMEAVTSLPGGGTQVTPMRGGTDTGAKLDTMISLLQRLIDTTAAVPGSISSKVGGALTAGGSRASINKRYGRSGG